MPEQENKKGRYDLNNFDYDRFGFGYECNSLLGSYLPMPLMEFPTVRSAETFKNRKLSERELALIESTIHDLQKEKSWLNGCAQESKRGKSLRSPEMSV